MFQAVDQDRSEPLIRADGQISSIRADRAGPDVCAEAERLYMHAACTGTEIAELLQPVLQTEPEQGTQIQLVAADTAERFPLPEQPLDRAVFDLVRGQRPPQTYRRLSQRQLDIRRIRRARLTEYAKLRPNAVYHEGKGVWTTKCDIALPCATQNELLLEDAKALVANGCFAVCEGANMPTSLDATRYLQESGIYFLPGKAANAGGVATSALEMTQNSQRLSWTFEEVDAKLKDIMVNIFHNLDAAAKEYGMEGNYVAGANIAGFLKVADAMNAQGIV